MDIYLATGNQHKVQEFRELAAAAAPALRDSLRFYSAKELGGMPAVVEDAGTFHGNSLKKAQALVPLLPAGAWAMADDSGLCVDALQGGPGVESAYYAGPQGDSAANLRKLVETMRPVPSAQRGAYFCCVLSLISKGREPVFFEGRCPGRLLNDPRGGAGFGYDPLFAPEGYEQSFAELGETVKHTLSHRGRAWGQMAAWLAASGIAGAGTSLQ